MQQGWFARARATELETRSRDRRRRRLNVGLALGLAFLLGACSAEGGTSAVQLNPLQPTAAGRHVAKPAPKQRWGSAAGLNPVVAGPRNTFRPKSLRSQYPVLKAPSLPANTAELVKPPAVTTVRGFSAGTSREVPAERSARQRVYDNADGTQTTQFSAAPINYRKPDGTWAPIDSTLVKDPAGGWRRSADSVDLRVADRADAAELVRVTLPGGGVLAYGAEGAGAVPAAVEGDTARFAGVWQNVDIELQAQPGGIKETLVLGSAAAPRSYVFPLKLTGLTAALDGDRVVLKNPAGAVAATIPAGYLVDAKSQTSPGVTYKLITRAGAPALQVLADADWLAQPGRAFPVRLDPPVLANAASESLIVQGGSSHSGGDLAVGRRNGVNSASYLRFPDLVSSLSHETIYSAQLSFAAFEAPSCKARPMSVHPVTGSWSKNDTGQDYPGPSVGAALATTSFAQGYVALGQASSACPVTGTVLNLGSKGRDLVQGWVDGKANNGLGLRAPTGDESAWKTIAGVGTANPPKLYVTHSPYNAKYAVPDPTPKPAVLQNQAGKVKITVTNKSAMSWTPSGFRLVYRVYNAQTNAKVGQYIAANLPATLARNASVTLDATIKPLPVGQYLLDFSMSTAAGRVFTDELVPPARIALRVDNIAPVVGNLFPPNGYQSPTLTPQLWAQAVDLDAPPKQTLQYKFEYCAVDSAGKPTGCTATAYQAKQSFTIPAAKLKWSTSYLWRAFVKDNTVEVSTGYATLITSVPQPEITSRVANAPYGSSERDFDPDLGNFSTGAVDATIPAAGPVLNVTRTYNSLDPRRNQLFGAGWMTQFDMRVVLDADGSGNAVVTYADGQQVRFGHNADGTFAAPPGRTASLIFDGNYLLRDVAGTLYTFRGSDGKILQITDKWTRALVFSYTADARLTKVLSRGNVTGTTGRALTFGWNAANTHITSVSTDPLNGRTLVWTYAYDGDVLKTVCAPGAQACTNYTYAAGSHYRSGVLDSDPDSYWRFGEKAGATAAGSEIGNNLGKDAGVLRNVTLEQPGALPGTDNTAALFNGTTSVAELPKGIVKRSRDSAVELWFKMTATQTGGPLVGYQDKAVDSTATVGVPLLYVGLDGHVRGQFKTTVAAPKPIDGQRDVRDNKWHHVALSVTADVQSLYLDGVKVGSKPATDGVLDQSLLTFNQVGAGWATTPASWPSWGTTAKRYFNGSADEVAVYGHALSDQAVRAHWTLGTAQADQLAVVTQASGKIAAETVYDTDTDRVKEYTDGNGGTWKIGTPTYYGGDTDLRRTVQVLDPADRPYLYEYDGLVGRMLRSGSPLGLTTRPEDKPLPPTPSPAPTPTEVCSSPDPGDPQFCTTIPGDAGGPIFDESELTGTVIRSFGYDALGRQNQIVNENGESVIMTFDARGNVVTRRTCRKVGDCQTSYTSYTTPSTNPIDPRNDLPIEVRDPRSASATDNTYRTTTAYSATGDVQNETGPDFGVTATFYTSGSEIAFGTTTNEKVAAGLVASVTDAMSRITKFRYTARGDLAQVTAPSGLITEYSYDELGRRVQDKEISDTYPDGVITTYAYDDLGRPITTTGPVTVNAVDNTSHQAVTTKTYDLDGNVVRTSVKDALDPDEPERVTTIEYDEYNRQTRTTNPVGDEQVEGWDQFGNRVSVLDGNGNQYGYAFTARNALAEVRLYDWHGDPDGGRPQDDKLGYVVLNSYAYDFAGRMAAQLDSMGRRLEYTYFSDDLVSKIVQKNFHNVDGTTRDFVLQDNTYDAAGNVTRQAASNQTEVTTNLIDALGRTANTTFDPGGLNRSTGYIYDRLGNVTQTTQTGAWSNVPGILQGGLTNVVANVYSAKGQLAQTKEVAGSLSRATSYTYDQRGLLLTTTDPRGNVTTYRYDQNGDRVASVAPAVSVESGGNPAQTTSPTVTTGYNAFGEAVATKDALGNIARTGYDRMGRVVEVDSPLYTAPGSPDVTASAVTTTRYDALNNVVETTDPRGNVSRYTYDRMNRVVQSDEPGASNDERAVTKYTYTRTGKLLSSTSPTGIRTEATYDDLDRQITSTRFERKPVADTLTTTTAYDDAGNVTQVKSPTGLLTKMQYNRAGDLITTIDPANVTTQIGYDPFGNQARETDGAGRTTRRLYNGFGDVTAEVDQDPEGDELRRETYDYDDNGNVTARTDALKNKVTFGYDALDRLTTQVEQKSATDSITTSFGYDASGFRTRYTDGRANSTFYTANSLGLPENVIEPATAAQPSAGDRTWTVSYDLNGNAARLSAPGGVNRTRTYDAANRMIAEDGSGTATTANRGLTYDLEDRVTVVTAGGANASTYDYDDRGDLLKATGPTGNASYTYDDDGDLTARTDAVGTATFSYKQGRTDTMKDAATGVTQKLGYTTAGTVQSIDYGAGRVRAYGYDDLGRLTSDVLKNGSNAEVAKVNYRYDLADHLTGKDTFGTAGAGTNTYDYDDAGRMTAWTSSTGKVDYAWDDSGNRTKAGSKSATYDQRNRLLNDSDYTYTYTPRGTMATRTSSGLTDSYSFDAFDRLVSAEGESYVYDGLNRVINRNGTLFQYAGFEQDPVDDGTESYARGPNGELLAVEDGANNTRITVSDQHDDVVGAFDPNGTLTALSGSTAYDPYGEKTATTGTQSHVGFQGDWTDPDTGQVDMGARWYEPGTGTFTSRDTVSYSQGDSILANKYTYGAGDPMSNSDPTGNWPSCGWCKKAASKAWHATTSAVSTAYHTTVSAGSWLYNQAKAGVSAVYRSGVSLFKSAGKMIGRAFNAVRSGYNRYLKPALSQVRDYAAKKAAEVHAAAVRVTAKATAAIQTAVKHVSLKRLSAAVVSQLSALKLAVSSALPAKLVQSFNSVVQDLNSATAALYKSATAVGGSLVGGLEMAGDWVVDHKAQIIGGIAGAIVGLGCGLAIGVTGVGAVACAAAGGAIGSLVTDLVEGGKGWKEMAADALIGGTIGAVMGPLSSVGGSAVTGAFRGLVSGGLREAVTMGGSAASSTLRSFGSTQVGGLVGRAMAGRAAGSASREAVESAGASVRSSVRADAGRTCNGVANSFAPGTAVLMADGTTKKIEDVRVGDKVLATDPTTGKTQAKAVTQLIIGIGEKQMVEVTVDIDGAKGTKTATITATEGHPFWSPDLRKWVNAGDLKPDSMLRTGTGTYVKVTVTKAWTALAQQVRNLTVDGLHTYYVMAGDIPLLVHNCGGAAFVADAKGTVLPTSASRLQSGLQAAVDAGEPGFGTFPTRSAGVGYSLPSGETIRIMQPSGPAGLRASFEQANGQAISPFTGRQVIVPRGMQGAAARQYSRERSHVELEP